MSVLDGILAVPHPPPSRSPVTDQLPSALADAVARITSPEPTEAAVPPDLTGSLAELAQWWRTVSGGSSLTPVTITCGIEGDATTALSAGLADAERAIDGGATLLVPRAGHPDRAAACTLIAVLTRRDPSAVLDQPDGMSDRDWMVMCTTVRDRAARMGDQRGDPMALLARSSPGIAYVCGALLAAAARRTPSLVDGTDELAAALVADRIAYRAKQWWRTGSDSPDPGRQAAVDRIDLPAGLPLGLTDDAGRGAQATVALLATLLD